MDHREIIPAYHSPCTIYMKTIIIDDERKGRELLAKLLADHCPGVEVRATAADVEQAIELIRLHKPQLVFLDIEMPGSTGFSIFDHAHEANFEVIVTTAFNQYALQAIKHHVFDYLLKPIDVDELKKAVEAVKQKTGDVKAEAQKPSKRLAPGGKLGIAMRDGIVYCTVKDIIRIESDGSYSTVYLADGKRCVASKGLGEYEELLPLGDFFRVHKSHLINVQKVRKYIRTDGNFLEMEDGSVIEIARRKKDEFLQLMSSQE